MGAGLGCRSSPGSQGRSLRQTKMVSLLESLSRMRDGHIGRQLRDNGRDDRNSDYRRSRLTFKTQLALVY